MIGDFFDDGQDIFGGFAIVEYDRQIEFASQVKLMAQHLLLRFFVGAIPVIIESDLTDSDELVAMVADGVFDGGELHLPIILDIFGMQAQRREAEAWMGMAHIEHRADGSRIDAGYDHGAYACFALAQDDLLAIGVKSFFVNMAVSVDQIWDL